MLLLWNAVCYLFVVQELPGFRSDIHDSIDKLRLRLPALHPGRPLPVPPAVLQPREVPDTPPALALTALQCL